MTHGVHPLVKLLFSSRVVNIHPGFGVSCFRRLFRKTFFSDYLFYVLAGDCLKQAIPLCLPNNYTWNSETGQVVQTEEKRRSLYVVEEALEQLRRIKGKILSGYSLSNGIVLLPSLYH